MKVNFFLKDPLKKTSSVISIIRYKGNRFKLTTGVSVEVAYWDKSTHRARKVREYPDHETINIQLNQFESAANNVFTAADISKTMPTLEELKQACAKQAKPDGQSVEVTLLTYFINYAENHHYKERTRLSYQTTARILERYEKHTRHRLQFADINIDFYNHFKHWVSITPRPTTKDTPPKYYSINTFGTFIKHIKTVMREAGPEGDKLHTNAEYKHRNFIKDTEEADTIYLTTSELTRIHRQPINYATVSELHPDLSRHHIELKIEAINHARAMLLIGCYTALRISDFSRLSYSNISDKYIRIKPVKGTRKNEDVVIPIHPVIAEILAAGFDFTHIRSHQRINEHIKEICQLAAINDEVTTVRTEGGRQVTRTTEKYKLVASHTCRRSGATNMFIAGIPAISIMKITGHKTERSFMKYIRISQEENARLLADHPFFKVQNL